jgi:hypothetical protein
LIRHHKGFQCTLSRLPRVRFCIMYTTQKKSIPHSYPQIFDHHYLAFEHHSWLTDLLMHHSLCFDTKVMFSCALSIPGDNFIHVRKKSPNWFNSQTWDSSVIILNSLLVSKTKGFWNWNLEPDHLVAKTMKMSILDVECCCILKSIPQFLESWRKDNWLSEESSNWFESLSWYDRFPGNAKGSNNSPAQARRTSSLI